MKVKFFKIPVFDNVQSEEALNKFCSRVRVVDIEKHFVPWQDKSCWAVCVNYLDGTEASRDTKRHKTDYKTKLNEQDFSLYLGLRELRKTIALDEDNVPVYVVFTNDQLAEIAEQKPQSLSQLKKINGVGEARIEKYGQRILEYIKKTIQSRSLSKPTDVSDHETANCID